MNLDQIATKCFILALFIRDDGQRLLLGDGYYEFNQKLQHFQANTIANDVVEIQGDNGQLLAGQVMRSGAQKFEGYIGDATTNRQIIEQKRSDFMAFFRIKHFYNVIYIFPDGTAIQRQRGYLTDAPTIPEIFQKFPEYSVALNFEDANYYEYAEDEHGDEIYAHIAELALAGGATGGLVWDAIGAVTNGITWSGIQTAQGEYIQITNELDIPAKLASVEMLGKAEQTTYSGKNLFDGANPFGVTGYNQKTISLPAGKYTITASAITTNGTDAMSFFNFYNSDNQSVGGGQLSHSTKKLGVTLSADATSVYIYAQSNYPASVGKTTTFTNLMIESGTTATAYEPYVGGTPAPNPSFPQPISVVAGGNVVKIEGKNLFDKNSAVAGLLNRENGQLWTSSTYMTSDYIKVEAGQTYASTGFNNWYRAGFNAQKQWTSLLPESDTFTIPNGVSYIRTSVSNANLDTAQLELGSTATTYEPYQGQEFEVNLGKNLFNKDNYNLFNGYFNGEPTGTITANANNDIFYIACQPNTTYTISKTASKNFAVASSAVIPSAGSAFTGRVSANNQSSATITTDASAKYLLVWARNGNISGEITRQQVLDTLQIERGSQASSYAPYFTPIELAKIGDYQDRIYKEDGKWYIEKQVGKVVLDGSADEGWSNQTGSHTTILNLYSSMASWGIKTGTLPVLCSIASYSTNAGANNDTYANICKPNPAGRFFILDLAQSDFATFADFTTWLASNPTTVYYALATPTTTEITNEALIAQLDALGASSLYLGVNNIGTETLNAMPTLKIEYYTEYTLDGAGYEWEPGGNTARTIVTVAGVDSAWPIWTIQGGAQNPTLTNITTGQTISWQGFVPEGQTLTINMAEMTADLAGANVFEYITGEWLRLAPGNNTLVYNAGNADKPSTLSWNGVLA